MNNKIFRVYVEKIKKFDIESNTLFNDLKYNLGIKGLTNVRKIKRYYVSGISEEEFKIAVKNVFSEPQVDLVYTGEIKINKGDRMFGIQYLNGQYDQRADSAEQCIQLITQKKKPIVKTANIIVLSGNITDDEFKKIKKYCINAVDSCEAKLEMPENLELFSEVPEDIPYVDGFIDMDRKMLEDFINSNGLAMNFNDIKFCQDYFKNKKRNPTMTEIKVLDTYWSDHCRHTTFNTIINDVDIDEGKYKGAIEKALREYLDSRKVIYKDKEKSVCLMDMACMGGKVLKKLGKLDDLEESDEINACSIEIDVDVDGKNEKWLLMFKNETHNHPTEIEPFGGAATCLGGAIRDPLSGRSYVYQAMRVTGSGDPTVPIDKTMKGKLPQIKITREAADGYSSYGNQIGLATGQVHEVYDNGFIAKRMEIGAVIGAAPKKNVKRLKVEEGDLIVLLGGRTGRDGCGGATGSSKKHNIESINTCGAEVQKGNPVEERKIQRFFRNEEVSKMIKKCNDFGAGGVSVAIGELADGIDINLDLIPKKYEGLTGTELAISESQERMAVVVHKDDAEKFIKLANKENIEATVVAVVTSNNRLVMKWRGKTIVNLDRKFLDSNGAPRYTDVLVKMPDESQNYFKCNNRKNKGSLEEKWCKNLEKLNICSQRGLVEKFDSTIGASTVLMPYGGKYQATPIEGMVSKIPVLNGETNTASIMAFGYNPKIANWSPFHGAVYALIEAVTKVVACGGDYKSIRLTLQEYFERLEDDKEKWGKPFAALLGAFHVQKQLEIPAIGGKDSMSGTFEELNVPPTLVAFAVDTANCNDIVSPEFKNVNSKVVLIKADRDDNEIPCFDLLKKNYELVNKLIKEKKIISAMSVKDGGIAEALSKMCFGNMIGIEFADYIDEQELFAPNYGSMVLELSSEDVIDELKGINYKVLGQTINAREVKVNGVEIGLKKLYEKWSSTLEDVFPTKTEKINENMIDKIYTDGGKTHSNILLNRPKPRVVIPVFPGTNCEYDCMRAFKNEGAEVKITVFRNLSQDFIKQSIDELSNEINNSQIIMLPGGFSAGDEPDGSGKFIANVFRNPKVKESVMNLVKNRDGLILGICNGFQVLIKLGLIPFGEIVDVDENCPTLTFNKIGRHVSRVTYTKIVSNLSPWLNNVSVNDIHSIPVSHGEGRVIINDELAKTLFNNGQIATQYVDFDGNPTYDIEFNPNGSMYAIEGMTSPDGRILGKMGHSERIGNNILKNIIGEKDQKIFKSGVEYFL